MSLLTIILLMTVLAITDAEVKHRTQDNEMGLSPPIIIAYYRFGSKTASKMASYWYNRLKAVSEEHKHLLFTYSDSDQFKDKLLDYGFEFDWKKRVETEPIVIAEDKNASRYLLDSKLTTDSLRKFVEQFKSNQLVPLIKSEPIPDNTNAVVKEVVGKTFKEMVIENPKDVLIMMYAHWCGHCKEALPQWQTMGEKLADEPDVDVLQMDVSKNYVHKPFKTLNYPTIYFLSADDKYSTQKFIGKRSVLKLIQWVSKKATKPLLKYDRKGKARKEGVQMSAKTEL